MIIRALSVNPDLKVDQLNLNQNEDFIQKYNQENEANASGGGAFGCFGFCAGPTSNGQREYRRRPSVKRVPLSQNMPFAACREPEESAEVKSLRNNLKNEERRRSNRMIMRNYATPNTDSTNLTQDG